MRDMKDTEAVTVLAGPEAERLASVATQLTPVRAPWWANEKPGECQFCTVVVRAGEGVEGLRRDLKIVALHHECAALVAGAQVRS